MSQSSRLALVTLVAALMLAPAAALHPVVSHLYVAGLENIATELTHLSLLAFFAIALVSVFPAVGFAIAMYRVVSRSAPLRAITSHSQPAQMDGFHYRRLSSDAIVVFTAGILRPATFVSLGAERALGGAKLRAALLHEEAHRRSRDVMWRLLLRAIGRGFAFVPWISEVVESETLRTECEADDYAIRGGARRLDLFDAIVAASNLSANPLRAGLTDGDTEFRLVRLVHPEVPLPGRPTRHLLALAAAVALPALVAHVLVFAAALGTSHWI